LRGGLAYWARMPECQIASDTNNGHKRGDSHGACQKTGCKPKVGGEIRFAGAHLGQSSPKQCAWTHDRWQFGIEVVSLRASQFRDRGFQPCGPGPAFGAARKVHPSFVGPSTPLAVRGPNQLFIGEVLFMSHLPTPD
jgi:hypothetical protein